MIRLSLPAGFVAAYGAGYPVTYLFDVPDQPGLVGQWSPNGRDWSDITPAPAGRFDGIEAARFDAGRAYLSVAFPLTGAMFLRVWDGAQDVGVYRSTTPYYDARTAGVIFTYDDWAQDSLRGEVEATTYHRAAGLWASGGINSQRVAPADWATIQSMVDLGWFEPINHGRDHRNALNYGTYGTGTAGEDAYRDVVVGRDEILAALTMPPQSRGHMHGFIEPNGNSAPLQRQMLAASDHLADRNVANAVLGSQYLRWSHAEGMPKIGYPTRRTLYTVVDTATQEAMAVSMLSDLTKAIAARSIVHYYSYTRFWDVSPGGILNLLLDDIGACDNIWSVGWGHHALYRRICEVVKVQDFPVFAGESVDLSGEIVITPPPGRAGSLLVAIRADSSAGAQSAPDGWTLLSDVGGLAVWWRIADGSEGATALSGPSNSRYTTGVLLRFDGVDLDDPIAAWAIQQNASGVTSQAPGVASGPGLVLHIWKAQTNARVLPPYGAALRTLTRNGLEETNVTVGEYVTPGDPPPMTADLAVTKTSVAATLVLTPAPANRRRGAVAAMMA